MSETQILTNLLARLESLQATVEQQQTEISRLSAAQSTPQVSNPTTTSRRKLLKRLAAVAAGAAATTTALAVSSQDAAAGSGSSASVGFYAFVGGNGTESGVPTGTVGLAGSSGTLFGGGTVNAGVYGVGNNNGFGVRGTSFGATGTGVSGTGAAIGVDGSSSNGIGVSGSVSGLGKAGVAGRVAGNNGVVPSGTGVAGLGSARGVYGSAELGNGGTLDIYGVSGNASLPLNVGGLSTAYGVHGNASSGSAANQRSIGVYGNASTYGGSFSGGNAPLYLTPSGNANPPAIGTHEFGELYVDTTTATSGNLFFCTSSGTPGTWVRLSNHLVAGANISLTPNANGTTTIASTAGGGGVANVNGVVGAVTLQLNGAPLTANGQILNIVTPAVPPSTNITFLTSPIRVTLVLASDAGALTSDGTSTLTSKDIGVVGVLDLNGSGLSVPAGAKGIVGSLTSVGATTSGNLRLWPSGSPTPVVNTLNIPAKPDGTGFNLTTSVLVGLGAGGKVSIGFAGGANSKCGYALDIAGYIV